MREEKQQRDPVGTADVLGQHRELYHDQKGWGFPEFWGWCFSSLSSAVLGW